MDKEQADFIKSKFEQAYAWRADASDIDWKPTRYKDRATGQWKEGPNLAYLSWAVAWRTMKEIYPDANYRLIETVEGSPLWNINGYGMLKCAVSACGIEHVETFPVMTGGQNEGMPIADIDCRDVNDSAQRGFTKAIARFGVGLYIFEGKLAEAPQKPQKRPVEPKTPLNEGGVKWVKDALDKSGLTAAMFIEQNGFDPYESRENALKAYALLKPLMKGNE